MEREEGTKKSERRKDNRVVEEEVMSIKRMKEHWAKRIQGSKLMQEHKHKVPNPRPNLIYTQFYTQP